MQMSSCNCCLRAVLGQCTAITLVFLSIVSVSLALAVDHHLLQVTFRRISMHEIKEAAVIHFIHKAHIYRLITKYFYSLTYHDRQIISICDSQ